MHIVCVIAFGTLVLQALIIGAFGVLIVRSWYKDAQPPKPITNC